MFLMSCSLSRALTQFQWQSYVPTLALLVSDPSPNGLGQNITVVGYLYFAFVGTSILSSITLHAHLRHFTPYSLLCFGYALRAVSGALHAYACALVPSTPEYSLPLLIASRVLHGYTMRRGSSCQ